MKVRKILETALYVNDLQIAENFYTHVLGLEVFEKSAGRHLFFRVGESMLLIFDPAVTKASGGEVPPHGTTGSGHIAFSVQYDEIDEWRKHLQREKVEIEREINWSQNARSLYFRDPSGNSVELATSSTWGFI